MLLGVLIVHKSALAQPAEFLRVPPLPRSERSSFLTRGEFVSGSRVGRWDVNVERPEWRPPGVSNFVAIASLDEQQGAGTQVNQSLIHGRSSGSGDDVKPLVRAAVTIVSTTFGLAGSQCHLGRLRMPIAEHDVK